MKRREIEGMVGTIFKYKYGNVKDTFYIEKLDYVPKKFAKRDLRCSRNPDLDEDIVVLFDPTSLGEVCP